MLVVSQRVIIAKKIALAEKCAGGVAWSERKKRFARVVSVYVLEPSFICPSIVLISFAFACVSLEFTAMFACVV